MPAPIFVPTRAFALDRLAAFLPCAGRAYAEGRNTDPGGAEEGAVSRLSPYLRHRMLTEQETVSQVLAAHGLPAAEKFIHEVLWRSYWKGWLEMRPAVWRRFLAERDRHRSRDVPDLAAAEAGRTGIDCFDHWVRELADTGYLHNHARMWFASIWIFTLRLPWALGADVFLRHLIDADQASNTLSWRWVAGLHTPGKTYLATAGNIARYTNGRFAPQGLATAAQGLTEPPLDPPALPPEPAPADPRVPSLLVVTHEDMHPESLVSGGHAIRSVLIASDAELLWGGSARRFVRQAAEDAAQRAAGFFGCPVSSADRLDAGTLIEAAQAAGVTQLVVPYAPVGPVADALSGLAPRLARAGLTLVPLRRRWDQAFWPHAKKGFFAFKEHIPAILAPGGLT